MKTLMELFPVVKHRVVGPVLVVLGSPWPVTQLVRELQEHSVTCFQYDLFPAARLREKIAEQELTADVVTAPDLWDLTQKFKTVIFPAAAQADRELKLDCIDQGASLVEMGGLFISLSEYEKDNQFAKWHKKIFGKCSESPTSEAGMAFWSVKTEENELRRHELNFHARIGDGESMNIVSYPGTFGYGRMDGGARAMLEVAYSMGVQPGSRVLDMGCGNGSVGCLAYPWTQPGGHVTFIDSNVRATALAKRNAEANGLTNFTVLANTDLTEMPKNHFDVILANPPYYANSEVARLFIARGKELLKRNGRFFLVTKMPVQTIPEVVDTFGEVESIENRGYTVLVGQG
ncbi:MAG: class I SAM-dependent methyltransferase [Fimbriiglobus sp.]